ncbi:zinc-dependent alcohol dehydrogenase family protein [Cerasicoccus fimbriatus]|uniref:zinc-dependent alcohol dehydrogenase family protein n=1 Tax=Cerasicoccus fimbriatus TaxID=3014554 RepID=UPI0022B513DE|nr:zinc-dependent alcohol dehydrogenase family protein [Cerasicoccus sp. TK19100]
MKTRAAVLHSMEHAMPYRDSLPLKIETLELEAPDAGEVLVKVAAASLCHSDLSVINGSRPRVMPMVMGHEASGVVQEVGANVKGFAPGDHVVFSYFPACGCCAHCGSGRAVLCEDGAAANGAGTLLNGARKFTNGDGERLNHHLGVSGFSEYTVAVPESLVKIDPELPLEIAAMFGCAVLTGVGAVVNTAKAEPGKSVAVFGLGGVGLSAVMGARAVGAYPIVAVDPLDAKLELARQAGATHVVNALADNAIEAVREITKGGAAVALEAVGSVKVLENAYAATARGGKTVSIGLPHPSQQLSISALSLVAEERILMGSYMGSAVPKRDVPRFIAMYQNGILPVNQLQSKRIRLDDINAAFDDLHHGKEVRQVIVFE